MEKNLEQIVEIIMLVIDKDNNIYMEIGIDKNYSDFIATNVNIKDIFKKGIVNILKNYKVKFSIKEINYFLDKFMQRYEYKISIPKLYTGLISAEVDEYLKEKYHTKATKKNFGKIDRKVLEKFLNDEFKNVAVNYILQEDWQFLKYYAVILDKPIKIEKNGKEAVIYKIQGGI